MKNSILSIFAMAALMACQKNETTTVGNSSDSTAAMSDSSMANDSSTSVNDSTATTKSTTSNNKLSNQDKMFADAAAQGGMAEVMLGELASSYGTNASVKSLGAMMVKDHGKANGELKAWATSAGYILPASVNAEQQKTYDELKSKKGSEFDKMFSEVMVTDHKKMIAAFKKESTEGTETSLRSFATKTLPALEHHLMESEKTKAAVK